MVMDLLSNRALFRKVRWLGVCLATALSVVMSFLIIAAESEFNTGQERDVLVTLSITHKIKITEAEPGQELKLMPHSDNTATGSKDYCVISNKEDQLRAKVSVVPAGGGDYKLVSSGVGGGKKEVPFEAFIVDRTKTNVQTLMTQNSFANVGAVSDEKKCNGNPTTQLFVKANIAGITLGDYSAKLQMRFSAE